MALCHPTHTPFWQFAMWPAGECSFPQHPSPPGKQERNRQDPEFDDIYFLTTLFFDHIC